MQEKPSYKLNLNPAAICKWLLYIVLALGIVHILVLVLYFWIDDTSRFNFVELVDLDYEGNLPTLFNALLFIISATLLMVIWRHPAITDSDHHRALPIESGSRNSESNDSQWLGLAIIFLFLGVDEGVKLHEYIGDWMEQFVDAKGFLYFPWVIPYLTIFGLLVLVYLPFYLRLPLPTKRGFFIAALVFLCGAVVLDIVGAREADVHGTNTILYSVLYTVEEILEMIGLIIFIRTLLNYICISGITVSVKQV